MANSAYISEYEFFPIGYCIGGSSITGDDSKYDIMLAGCSIAGKTVSFDIYSTTDGSCGGDVASTASFKQKELCGSLSDVYQITNGYLNFKCSGYNA